jgi:hypothetical protein
MDAFERNMRRAACVVKGDWAISLACVGSGFDEWFVHRNAT